MKLRRLRVNSLPGIGDPYEVEFRDGLTVVEGPNEVGKSSLARTLGFLLWPTGRSQEFVSAFADFEDEEGSLRVTREGPSVRWERAGEEITPPLLPDEHLKHSFFIGAEELVDVQAKQGEDVAAEIRRQMAGGYDLHKVLDLFPNMGKSQRVRKAGAAFQEANRKALDEENRQGKIAQDAQRLDALHAEVEQGERARREGDFVRAAQRLAARQGELKMQQAQLAQLPATLETLSGETLERLDQRLEEQSERQGDKIKSERDLEKVRAEVKQCGLEQPVDARVLATLDEKSGVLRDTQRKLEDARGDRAACAATHAETRKAVGGSDGVNLELGDGSQWFEFLRKSNEVDAERLATGNLLRHLGQRGSAPDQTENNLRDGERNLRLWLQGAGANTGASPAGPNRLFRFGGALALVVAALLAVLGLPYWSLPLGLGIGLLLSTLASPSQSPVDEDLRARARREYPANLEAPAPWAEPSVQDRLQELTQALAKWKFYGELERERSSLQNRLDGLEEQAGDLAAQRQDLADRMGVGADLPDAELVGLARALDQHAQASAALAAAEGTHAHLQDEVADQLAALGHALEAQGEVAPADVPGAKPAVEQLKLRSGNLARALESEQRIVRELERLEAEAGKIDGYIIEIYESAGLQAGDRAGLENLVRELLPEYVDLRSGCRSLLKSVAEAQKELEGAPEGLSGLGSEALEAHSMKLEARVEKLEGLQREVAEISERVKLTRVGDRQTELLAQQHDALELLAACHDEGLDNLAGQFLMGRVSEQHKRDHEPIVKRRASELFGKFTHQGYELEVARDGSGSFLANDTRRKETLKPSQLSTGTRAQLLLAARIAFVETSQAQNRLPIFMDEALDHSDTQRFSAIATSLGEVAKAGWQIIYLTNDPKDASLLERALVTDGYEEPHRIDLGEIRGRGVGSLSASELDLPPIAAVPEPGEASAAAYGAQLGVPALALERGAPAQHLFYVLEDNLEALHQLLDAGIETVGQWWAVLRNDVALAGRVQASLVAAPTLEKRAQLLEEFCSAWSVGRGRCVDLEALLATEALSPRWLEPVADMAAELNGDAPALLAALRTGKDERRKGLQEKVVDKLEQALRNSDHLSDATVFGQDEVKQRVLASDAALGVDASRVTNLVQGWWAHAQRAGLTSE